VTHPASSVIPITPVDTRAQESLESGKRNFRALLDASPWLKDLEKEALGIAKANASPRSKYAKLRVLADRIAEAMAPYAACRKSCAHCCHKSVPISTHEAESLSASTGRQMRSVRLASGPKTVEEDLPTDPCPFLVDSACSIYEQRPIACRVAFNLAEDDFFCDPAVAPPNSVAPAMKMDVFLMAFAIIFSKQPVSDIRSFFASREEPVGHGQ
jgi:Fe-S-cluster containining protein